MKSRRVMVNREECVCELSPPTHPLCTLGSTQGTNGHKPEIRRDSTAEGRKGGVMVNFVCQLPWALGCPALEPNATLVCLWRFRMRLTLELVEWVKYITLPNVDVPSWSWRPGQNKRLSKRKLCLFAGTLYFCFCFFFWSSGSDWNGSLLRPQVCWLLDTSALPSLQISVLLRLHTYIRQFLVMNTYSLFLRIALI